MQKTTKKTREIADFADNRGFGPKSRNLLHPWNRDFLEGQHRARALGQLGRGIVKSVLPEGD